MSGAVIPQNFTPVSSTAWLWWITRGSHAPMQFMDFFGITTEEYKCLRGQMEALLEKLGLETALWTGVGKQEKGTRERIANLFVAQFPDLVSGKGKVGKEPPAWWVGEREKALKDLIGKITTTARARAREKQKTCAKSADDGDPSVPSPISNPAWTGTATPSRQANHGVVTTSTSPSNATPSSAAASRSTTTGPFPGNPTTSTPQVEEQQTSPP